MLSRLGLASRREAEDWIRAGRLVVNGVVATLGTRVVPSDQVRLDGRPVRQRESRSHDVFLCHRSPGESLREGDASPAAARDAEPGDAASEDEGAPARTSIIERLPKRGGRRYIAISPMPRVDGGLEVVTSDGELAEKLQRAVRGLRVEFTVRVRGELDERQVQGLLGGELDRGERLAVEAVEPGGGEGANRWYVLAARGASGKDVRQLFERQGALVSRILRTRLGSLALDRRLGRGQFRRLENAELDQLAASLAPEVDPGAPRAGAESGDSTADRGQASAGEPPRREPARATRGKPAKPERPGRASASSAGAKSRPPGGRRSPDRGRKSGPRPSGSGRRRRG